MHIQNITFQIHYQCTACGRRFIKGNRTTLAAFASCPYCQCRADAFDVSICFVFISWYNFEWNGNIFASDTCFQEVVNDQGFASFQLKKITAFIFIFVKISKWINSLFRIKFKVVASTKSIAKFCARRNIEI